MKFSFLILLTLLFSKKALSQPPVNLLQETQEIVCQNTNTETRIEKKDKHFTVNNTKYSSIEFLDQAILASSSTHKKALIHLTPKSSALLIEGELFDFTEPLCKQVNDTKVCQLGTQKLIWSPTFLNFDGVQKNVRHYGVYPNDGTFFIAYDSDSKAIALIDYGSKFQILFGDKKSLSCQYQ